MEPQILVVDDEKEIADLITVYLMNENYRVHTCYTARDAWKCVNECSLDLAILDVMLPEMDGFTLCPVSYTHLDVYKRQRYGFS